MAASKLDLLLCKRKEVSKELAKVCVLFESLKEREVSHNMPIGMLDMPVSYVIPMLKQRADDLKAQKLKLEATFDKIEAFIETL